MSFVRLLRTFLSTSRRLVSQGLLWSRPTKGPSEAVAQRNAESVLKCRKRAGVVPGPWKPRPPHGRPVGLRTGGRSSRGHQDVRDYSD